MNNSDESKWKPAYSQLYTRWTKDVEPSEPLPEYPRPQLERREWMNLNGLWDYAIVSRNTTEVKNFDGKILVPYPIESALSGVCQKLSHNELLVYRRYFRHYVFQMCSKQARRV